MHVLIFKIDNNTIDNNACFNFQNRFDIFKSIKLKNEI